MANEMICKARVFEGGELTQAVYVDAPRRMRRKVPLRLRVLAILAAFGWLYAIGGSILQLLGVWSRGVGIWSLF